MKVRSQKGLFSTVIGTISDVITRESEIEKIAKRLCADSVEKDCLSEKRKLVYDFFKIEIPEIDYRINGADFRDKRYSQTVCYTTREGALDYFTFGKLIKPYIVTQGCKDIKLVPDAIYEYMHLIEFDKLINSETRDFAFTNMFGRTLEKVMSGYCWGERLDKKLRSNYLYKKTKKSFERARKEFEQEKL